MPNNHHHGHNQHSHSHIHGHHHHHGHHHQYGYYNGYYPQFSSTRSRVILGLKLGGLLIFMLGLFLEIASISTMGIAAASAVGATSSAALFSGATFGIGALILYGAVGLAYLYSGAREAHSTDKSILDILKSRVITHEKLSVTSIVNSIAAILWSPFLLIGILSGKAVKAATSSNKVEGFEEGTYHSDPAAATCYFRTKGHVVTPQQDKEPVAGMGNSMFPRRPTSESTETAEALPSNAL